LAEKAKAQRNPGGMRKHQGILRQAPSARQLVRDDRWDAQDKAGYFPVDSTLG